MLYVHIPFCRSFCTYCDFYSEVASKCRRGEDELKQETLFRRFSEALETEARARKDEIKASEDVATLYIGGGTPSVLPLGVYERLLKTLADDGCRTTFDEFTFEVNPEDVIEKGRDYVEGLVRLGVSRFSMGVQSFDDGILKWMNRRHTAAQAVEAYRILEACGVENISIDLIFGLPQLSDGLWRETLHKALDISSKGVLPRHISSYQLSVEPGSMLSAMVDKGRWQEATDEQCRRQYDILCEVLAGAGYHHYEISNFAMPGYEAVHNSAYWSHSPYVGLGPGAHSFMKLQPQETSDAGFVRKWNEDNLGKYLEAAQKGDFRSVQGGETLDEGQLVMEKIMLGLRTSDGLPEAYLRRHCPSGALETELSSGNLVRLRNGNVRIPESGFFISDNIISELI